MAADRSRRIARTIVQAVVGLAAGLPLIVAVSGVPGTTAGVGVVLAVAAGFTRVMAMPVVNAALPWWLRAEDPEPRDCQQCVREGRVE